MQHQNGVRLAGALLGRRRLLLTSREQGYPLTRLTANMEWAVEDLPGVEDLVEYEAAVNHVLARYDDAVV
jgi:hypothetical protein